MIIDIYGEFIFNIEADALSDGVYGDSLFYNGYFYEEYTDGYTSDEDILLEEDCGY